LAVCFDALSFPVQGYLGEKTVQQKHDHNDNQPHGQSAEKERKHRQDYEDEEYLNQ
jgi:hypothetical protein